MTRRGAIVISGSTLASFSLRLLAAAPGDAQAAAAQEPMARHPGRAPLHTGFRAALPLNADGSAPEHPESAAGAINDPLMRRTPNRQAPEIEFDYG